MLERLLGKQTEERAISFQTIWGAGDSYALTTNAGTVITQDESLKLGTVYACTRLIADSISTLPVDTYRRLNGQRVPVRPRPIWLDYPEPNITKTDHFQEVLVSLLIDGNAFTHIIRDESLEITGLTVLNPQHVSIHRDGMGRIYYRETHADRIILNEDMIHIVEMRRPGQLRGESRIELMKQSLGLTKALEEFAARFFGQGSTTNGVIEFPGNLTKEQAKNLVDGFEEGHKGLRKAHRPGILSAGAKFVKTGVDPDSAQMLESRRLQIEEVCRIFRCPPSMLGVTTPGAMSYASVESNQIHFTTHTLRPYIVKIEDAYSKLLPDGVFIKFTVDALLRGDSQTRASVYSTALQSGYMSINDVRRLEDFTPVDGGDVYRVPLANVDLGAANLTETDRKVLMAQRLISSGFEPSAVLSSLGLPDIAHTGVPSVMLQGIAQIAPENPASVYEVE
jgi:HK97 family phage portal protein